MVTFSPLLSLGLLFDCALDTLSKAENVKRRGKSSAKSLKTLRKLNDLFRDMEKLLDSLDKENLQHKDLKDAGCQSERISNMLDYG